MGNVAVDVARILAKSYDELRTTDIADYALERLSDSKVKNIYILARRGPAQAKFTHRELRELGKLGIAEIRISPDDLTLDPESESFAADNPSVTRLLDTMRQFSERAPAGKKRCIHLRFLLSPVEIEPDADSRVSSVRVEKNKLHPDGTGSLNSVGTGEIETIPACMVLRSVGYRGIPLDGRRYPRG